MGISKKQKRTDGYLEESGKKLGGNWIQTTLGKGWFQILR
jgi:hypothetical protein